MIKQSFLRYPIECTIQRKNNYSYETVAPQKDEAPPKYEEKMAFVFGRTHTTQPLGGHGEQEVQVEQ
jgi:hypothetical protein